MSSDSISRASNRTSFSDRCKALLPRSLFGRKPALSVRYPYKPPVQEISQEQTWEEPPPPLVLSVSYSPIHLNNMQTNRLHTMPTELMLHVASFLPQTSIIALRLSARYFHFTFPNPKVIDLVERAQFIKAMAEDNYLWNRRREAHFGIANAQRLTCTRCRCLHDIGAFPLSNLTLPSPIENNDSEAVSPERLCKGAKGRLHMCTHSSISIDDLLTLFDTMLIHANRSISNFQICTHSSHGDNPATLMRNAPVLGIHMVGSRILVTRCISVAKLPCNAAVTESMIKDRLRRLQGEKEFICPHISITPDFEFMSKSTKKLYTDGNYDTKRYPFHAARLDSITADCRKKDGACRVCTTLPAFCEDTACDTSWVLFRRHGRVQDEIVLCIRRRVGGYRTVGLGPRDPGWLAQIGMGACEEVESDDENSKGGNDGSDEIDNEKEEEEREERCEGSEGNIKIAENAENAENADAGGLMKGQDFLDKYKHVENADVWDAIFRAQGTYEWYLGPMKTDV